MVNIQLSLLPFLKPILLKRQFQIFCAEVLDRMSPHGKGFIARKLYLTQKAFQSKVFEPEKKRML